MGDTGKIHVTLDADTAIFEELGQFAMDFAGRGRELYVVGGMAVTIWGLYLNCPRVGMTGDIDSVLTSAVLRADVEAFARDLNEVLSTREYQRPEDWKDSRTGRFSYTGRDGVKFELLCGTPGIGKKSGTPPAHRLWIDPDTGEAVYAARTPWLDFVDVWTDVAADCGPQTFHVKVPTLAGLTALKIGAVRDKQVRLVKVLASPKSDAQVQYERSRLALHAADVVLIREMIERAGVLPDLVALCNQHTRVRDAGTEAADWFDDHPEERERVAAEQRNLPTGSNDAVQNALRI